MMSKAMATSSLCSAVSSKPWNISSGNHLGSKKTGFVGMQRRRQRRYVKVYASCDHDNFDGRLVDEDMIVLTMRIHDIEMTETSDRNGPPSDWMEWEKRYHAHYNSDVCEAVGLLQSQLMNTRPTLALGMLALVALSVPVSTAALMSSLLDIVKGIFSFS